VPDAKRQEEHPDTARESVGVPGGIADHAPDVQETVRVAESSQVRSVSLIVIATILVFAALYFARAFFIPVAIAALLSFVLSPIVRWLAKYHLPPPAGTALVLLLTGATAGAAGYALAGPIQTWIQVAPSSIAKAGRKLRVITKPVEQVTTAANQVAQSAATPGAAPRTVVVAGPTVGERLFGTSAAVLGGFLEVVLLLYALLAVGDLFLQKLVDMLPRRGDREKVIAIARTIESSISSYLGLTALINIIEGAMIVGAMALLGMPNPLLWGVLVAVAEFIPYLGMVTMITVVTIVALTTFTSVSHAFLVPGAYLVINFIQSNIASPIVLSRRLTLNPVATFLSLALWWWVWGIAGALLAVPLLAVFKILCDHVESLASIGAFLGDRDKTERRSIVRARLAAVGMARRKTKGGQRTTPGDSSR
jgi:predicted PurR-regulated permease PerM